MIQTSQEYRDLMLSNVRPKCEPKITVEGTDNTGAEISLVWNAQNIASLNYKRGIDPLGRELPYMTLEWTEIYYGNLNAQNYPEKYANVTKYMRVTLEFTQNLKFHNCWYDLLSSTWQAIKTKSWGQIKVPSETIRLPFLFLSAKPTVENHTIKWTAVDLLSLLDENVIKSFDGTVTSGIKIQNPILYLLVNARGTYRNAKYVYNALTSTINYLSSLPLDFWDRWNGRVLPSSDVGYLKKQVVFDGATKDVIRNYLSAFSYYLDFYEDKIVIYSAGNWNQYPDIMWNLPENVLYSYPSLTPNVNVSVYNFTNYNAVKKLDSRYELLPADAEVFMAHGYPFLKYTYGDYGTAAYTNGSAITTEEINYAIIPGNTDAIMVTPIDYEATNNYIDNDTVGEAYVEDNPINPFDKNSVWMDSRFDVIKDYFNNQVYSMVISTIGNAALETSDIIQVATNLYSGNTPINKTVLVTEIDLKYTGALKETIKGHEVII